MNTFKRDRNIKNPERGIALLAALIALMLIAVITAGMLTLSSTETNISANFRDEQRAFFSAKAGIEEVRDRFRKNTTPASDSLKTAGVLPTTLPGTANSVLYITNPANGETVAPWKGSGTNYPDDEICNETSTITCTVVGSKSMPSLSSCNNWCTTAPASSTYTASPVLPWKWVRITLKQNNAYTAYATNGKSNDTSYVCWNTTTPPGPHEFASATPCASPNLPVYVLTALAVTPSGSRRMVQTEIAEDVLPLVPAPLTLDGPAPTFSNPSSSNYAIQGIDQGGCGGAPVPADNGPAIDVTTNPDITTIKTEISGESPNRSSNYTGVDGTTPDVNNVNLATAAPSLQTVSSLQNLLSTVKSNVTQPVINGPVTSIANPGTAAAPEIIYVNGDLTLSGNTTGYGILVVTGTFTASGTVGWNGLVLVVGQGVMIGTGGGGNAYNGAVVVAKTLDASGNPLATLGSPTFNWSGGGGNGINYSTGCLAQAGAIYTYHVIALREMMK